MMNVRETLKRLHRRLPTLSLDELFEVLDCYVEDTITVDAWQPKLWYSDNKNSISCSTSNKMDRKYDGNTTTTAEFGSHQFTTSH